MFNVLALGLVTGRCATFDVSQSGIPLSSLYDNPRYFTTKKQRHGAVSVNCVDKSNCLECMRPTFASRTDARYVGNWGCTERILTSPEFVHKAREMGLLNATWSTFAFERVFRPGRALAEELAESPSPRVVAHVRLGGSFRFGSAVVRNEDNPSDVTFFPDTPLEELIRRYASCVATVAPSRETAVLALSDSETAAQALVEALRKRGYSRAHTSPSKGNIHHVERGSRRTRENVLRTHVEFEWLRRADVVVAGRSGFSYFAHKVRRNVSAVVVAGYDDCLNPFLSSPRKTTHTVTLI